MQTSKAKQLLEIIFEGHEVRYALVEGRLLFVQNDVADAIDLKGRALKYAVAQLDPDERSGAVELHTGGAVQLHTLGGPQRFATLTEFGVFHLLLQSRKPAAARFRRYFTNDVMPQVVKFGSYIPGATPSEQLAHMRARYKAIRAGVIAKDEVALAASNLITIAEFRATHAIPSYDSLVFWREVSRQARAMGVRTRKFFTAEGDKTAWPVDVLMRALGNFQPHLPLFLPV